MKWFFYAILVVGLAACGNDDKKITSELNEKLSSTNPGIQASVKDGVATLSGTCPDANCKTASEAAAREVKGVKQVINQIEVPAPPPVVTINPDDSLKIAVQTVLAKYNGVNADVADGVVTLTGNIKRSQLKELMQDVTATKPKRVVNQLQIK